MKKQSVLKFEDLTTEQKLGMVMAGIVRPIRCEDKYETFDENLEFVLDLIRKHSLGAVWVPKSTLDGVAGMFPARPDVLKRIKEAADYPILIFTDAESGFGDYMVGRHNAIGIADSEELAYTFGKVTGLEARRFGYNVVCDPVIDMVNRWAACGANNRSLGSDKYRVTALASAMAQGLHDAGVLTVAKHYPSAGEKNVDTHMAPTVFNTSYDELMNYRLYPYFELVKRGLIDGIMSSHSAVGCIDGDMPATVSKKVNSLIRDAGFDGFMITDALDMMGLKARFGDTKAKGMCVEAGHEFILPWFSAKKAYYDLQECYKDGIISDERLDEAVRRVLAAQQKIYDMNPKYEEITDSDIEKFNQINRNSVFAKTDDGIPVALDPQGKYYFVLLIKNESEIRDDGKVTVDTFSGGWYYPTKITAKIMKEFPNSTVKHIYQFPSPNQNMDVLQESLGYDDVIFINFADAPAYAGADNITHRIQALMNAMTITGRTNTILHFGNPYVLEEAPHFKRVLIGGASHDSITTAIDVLAGSYPAKGKLIYDVKLK